MVRDPSHWLVEDDNQGDYPFPEDKDEGFHNEFNPPEFELYDDDTLYESVVP